MEGSCQGVLAALVVLAGLAGRSRYPGGMSQGFHLEREPREALVLVGVAARCCS